MEYTINFKEENAGGKYTKMLTVVVSGLNDYKCLLFFFHYPSFEHLVPWHLYFFFFFILSKDECSMHSNRATVQEYSLVMHHFGCSFSRVRLFATPWTSPLGLGLTKNATMSLNI